MATKLDEHISFFGKCVLIEDNFLIREQKIKKKILVLGDVHLGYGDRNLGFLPQMIFKETVEDLEKVFGEVGKVDIVVLLGDVKHYFGGISVQEWKETREFIEILKEKTDKIVVVKGNHDTVLEPISRELGFDMVDYYILGRYGFLHGHKIYQELLDKKIRVLMCGHLHPAVTLREGVKSERYKCFLVGKWKGKKVVVVPSFFPLVEGGDVFYHEGNLGFPFLPEKADVFVVGGREILPFGKMKKLS